MAAAGDFQTGCILSALSYSAVLNNPFSIVYI